MIEILPTLDRVFMSVVGPSGCGRKKLFFTMLSETTFSPKFNHIMFLYREMQQIYINIEQKLGVIFKTFINVEYLIDLENALFFNRGLVRRNL